MKAAVYVRVSTEKQTTENQRAPLEQLARARGFEPFVYEEVASAAKRRPVFESMLADAHAGRVGAVIVAALDRLGRSMTGVVDTVMRLDRLNVQVISAREPWLDMGGPTRGLLLSIFGWVAEQERAILIERTRAGLERARRQGKTLGRPRASPIMLNVAREAVERGVSIRKSARAAGVKEATLRRFISRRAADKAAKMPTPALPPPTSALAPAPKTPTT